MKKIFENANEYVRKSDWKDLSVLKFCLMALGVIIGVCIPKEHKKRALITAGTVFAAACIPQLIKFFRIVAEKK